MRRRSLLISALALALPARKAPVQLWEGHGLGGALSLRLEGTPSDLALMAPRIAAAIAEVEAIASLHKDSELTRLNRMGHLTWPSQGLLDLLTLADQVHRATGGAFDPTVQPLYLALARGEDPTDARAATGWSRVQVTGAEIRLDRGQALTLNGIAQGWAADRIAALFRAHGYRALIDMGELQALGPWPVTAEGPGLRRALTLSAALAVSSPLATRIGAGLPHILGPEGQGPLWQTVAVTGPSAAVADALSTGFCLMTADQIASALRAFPGTAADFA